MRTFEDLRWDYWHGDVFDWWRDDCPECHEPLRYRIKRLSGTIGFDARHPSMCVWRHECGHELLIYTDPDVNMEPAHMTRDDGSVFVGLVVSLGFWTLLVAVVALFLAGRVALEPHPDPADLRWPLTVAFACLCYTAFAAIVAFGNWRDKI